VIHDRLILSVDLKRSLVSSLRIFVSVKCSLLDKMLSVASSRGLFYVEVCESWRWLLQWVFSFYVHPLSSFPKV
jgi:hypothetical protein